MVVEYYELIAIYWQKGSKVRAVNLNFKFDLVELLLSYHSYYLELFDATVNKQVIESVQ